MLIPRFTIRAMLIATAVCGLISLVLAEAVRGKAWAIGASVALASLFVIFALHAAVFAVAWLLAQVRSLVARPPTGTSPFASAGPPRQFVPPGPAVD